MIKTNKTMLKASIIVLTLILMLKLSLVFLWPFIFSLIIVLMVEPSVKFFMDKGLKRSLSVIISFTIYGIIIIIFIVYLWNYIGGRLNSLTEIIPNLLERHREIPILTTISENYERILLELKNILIQYKEKIFETIISTFNGFFNIFIILLTSFLISLDLNYLSGYINRFLGDKLYNPLKTSIITVNKLITIEFKLVSLTFLISTLSFWLLGFEDPLSIGIICGILDLLPVVGPLFVFVPIIVYLFTTKQVFIAFGLIFTLILMLVARQILEIKLLQGNLVLKPVLIIFSLYIGIILFGGIGILFGPVMMIMFKEVYLSLMKGGVTKT